MDFFNSIGEQVYYNLIYKDRYMYILQGLGTTLQITAFAVVIGIFIGVLIAMIKFASKGNKKLKIFEIIANIYLTVIRGTPAVVQLFIMYYVILGTSGADKVTAAIFAFGINSGAYIAEIVRSGILSVDKGQMEAGRSLGLSYKTTMFKIIFPQALKNIIPALCNEFIALLKETSVAGFIGVMDLSKAGDVIRSQTYEALIPLLVVAAIYLIFVAGLSALLSKFERRLRKSDIR